MQISIGFHKEQFQSAQNNSDHYQHKSVELSIKHRRFRRIFCETEVQKQMHHRPALLRPN